MKSGKKNVNCLTREQKKMIGKVMSKKVKSAASKGQRPA